MCRIHGDDYVDSREFRPARMRYAPCIKGNETAPCNDPIWDDKAWNFNTQTFPVQSEVAASWTAIDLLYRMVKWRISLVLQLRELPESQLDDLENELDNLNLWKSMREDFQHLDPALSEFISQHLQILDLNVQQHHLILFQQIQQHIGLLGTAASGIDHGDDVPGIFEGDSAQLQERHDGASSLREIQSTIKILFRSSKAAKAVRRAVIAIDCGPDRIDVAFTSAPEGTSCPDIIALDWTSRPGSSVPVSDRIDDSTSLTNTTSGPKRSVDLDDSIYAKAIIAFETPAPLDGKHPAGSLHTFQEVSSTAPSSSTSIGLATEFFRKLSIKVRHQTPFSRTSADLLPTDVVIGVPLQYTYTGKNGLIRAMIESGLLSSSTFPNIGDVIMVRSIDAIAECQPEWRIRMPVKEREVFLLCKATFSTVEVGSYTVTQLKPFLVENMALPLSYGFEDPEVAFGRSLQTLSSEIYYALVPPRKAPGLGAQNSKSAEFFSQFNSQLKRFQGYEDTTVQLPEPFSTLDQGDKIKDGLLTIKAYGSDQIHTYLIPTVDRVFESIQSQCVAAELSNSQVKVFLTGELFESVYVLEKLKERFELLREDIQFVHLASQEIVRAAVLHGKEKENRMFTTVSLLPRSWGLNIDPEVTMSPTHSDPKDQEYDAFLNRFPGAQPILWPLLKEDLLLSGASRSVTREVMWKFQNSTWRRFQLVLVESNIREEHQKFLKARAIQSSIVAKEAMPIQLEQDRYLNDPRTSLYGSTAADSLRTPSISGTTAANSFRSDISKTSRFSRLAKRILRNKPLPSGSPPELFGVPFIGYRPKVRSRAEKIRPEEIRELCELIRKRYALDINIWSLRAARPRDRQEVQKLIDKSNAALAQIRRTLEAWNRPDLFDSERDWLKLQSIRMRLNVSGGIRDWVRHPPWEDSVDDYRKTIIEEPPIQAKIPVPNQKPRPNASYTPSRATDFDHESRSTKTLSNLPTQIGLSSLAPKKDEKRGYMQADDDQMGKKGADLRDPVKPGKLHDPDGGQDQYLPPKLEPDEPIRDITGILIIECNFSNYPLQRFKRARCPQTNLEYFTAPSTCTLSFDGHILSATVEWGGEVVGQGQYVFTGDEAAGKLGV